jgi:hypothetical protein
MPTGSPLFQMNDWLRYLHICRELAACCHTSLRGVDRALGVAGG